MPPDGEKPNPAGNVVPLRGTPADLPRLPPANTEAEQALLGALLIDNRVWERVGDFLKPEHFANAMHGRILEAIAALIERGELADPIRLALVFDQDPAFAASFPLGGGAKYLASLAGAGAVLLPAQAEDYARHVHDLALRRELIHLGADILEAAHAMKLDNPAASQIERAETVLFGLAESGAPRSGFVPISAAMGKAIGQAEAAFKRGARITGVPTGFADLDALLGGLQPGDLVILAGRPSMGKTALALNIACNAAQHPPPSNWAAGMFSLEMADAQLAARILAERTGLAADWVRRGDLRQEQFDRLVAAQHSFGATPLWIDDTPALSVAALRSRARRQKRKRGLDLVVVDYLQLLLPARPNRDANRVAEVTEISAALKALAKELEVPVLALSQLSRAVEQRDDKRPLLADLRESGAIEQDADVVMFIYREEYYLREPPVEDSVKWSAWRDRIDRVRNQAELIVAKQRHGPAGSVKLHFDARTTRFSNLAAGE